MHANPATLNHAFLYCRWGALVMTLALLVVPVCPSAKEESQPNPSTYTNPLRIVAPGHGNGLVESCADPTLIRGQLPGDNAWYVYCTKDPLNDEDRNASGNLIFHNIPILKSFDLVNWTYVGDVFDAVPSWGEPTAGLWAPEIQYFNGKYYLYYAITDVKPEVSGQAGCNSDYAIGVATSVTPTGPWTDLGQPVVSPRRNGTGCNFFATIDPEVLQDEDGRRYIYYGSYYGGIEVRRLSADGFTAPVETATRIAIPNRYEAPEVVKRDGYYYLFVSAANCCNGPVTGYSVFAGRATNPTGPFVDREGVSLLAGRVGGTPVLSMNGNRWVGGGHNSVFTDSAGQSWTIYHAVDRQFPYFRSTTLTKRPPLIDALDWINGWPTVRGGLWASDTPQPAPAAQPGEESHYQLLTATPDEPGKLLKTFSDEFNTNALSPVWSWIREPVASTYGLADGTFAFQTQAADLHQRSNNASVLVRPAPDRDYLVETKVKLNVPDDGRSYNFAQAGIVIYGDDDNYVRLAQVSIWETRQTEFGKEYADPVRGPFYGSTLIGPPDETTWLRIVRRQQGEEELYTGYTSRDGITWIRGGTWTHRLTSNVRIGLVALGRAGFIANFDYVRVYLLKKRLRF